MNERTAIVESLYRRVLRRAPGAEELEFWTARSTDLASIPSLIDAFFESEEYKGLVRQDLLGHPPGHYYSPINNVFDLDAEGFEKNRRSPFEFVAPIELSSAEMESTWKEIAAVADMFDFPIHRSPGARYYSDNPVYGSGDALVLAAMIAIKQPKRIIEIGSGFSSACMLDVIDVLKLDTTLIFVEPHPDRLYYLLTEADRARCRIITAPVQQVDLGVFRELTANDILFIDSSHVVKSNSDVAFEIFNILPALNDGVIVHFHDMFWPFEYPVEWIFNRKYSWNEIYFLRAFLMYNKAYRILFFNDAFACKNRDAIAAFASPKVRDLFIENSGGGLWLRKEKREP